MVSLVAAVFLMLASPTADPRPTGADGVRPALRKGEFPWYDAETGRVKPVLSRPDYGAGVWKRISDALAAVGKWIGSWFRWLNFWRVPGIGGLGNVVAVGLVLLVFTLVLVGLLELLRRYRPPESETVTARRRGDRPGRAD